MIVVYILIGIILLVLVVGLFVSKDMNYEKSVLISAPIGEVWKHTNTLAAMDDWSPWNEKDPNMKKSTKGIDGTIGASSSWISTEKGVGEGSQTITGITEPTLMETRLDFLKPFKSTANAYVSLVQKGEQTNVTWGFKSQMPYPMNLMKVFMNFEKAMDGDFNTGLNKLKGLCEKK